MIILYTCILLSCWIERFFARALVSHGEGSNAEDNWINEHVLSLNWMRLLLTRDFGSQLNNLILILEMKLIGHV